MSWHRIYIDLELTPDLYRSHQSTRTPRVRHTICRLSATGFTSSLDVVRVRRIVSTRFLAWAYSRVWELVRDVCGLLSSWLFHRWVLSFLWNCILASCYCSATTIFRRSSKFWKIFMPWLLSNCRWLILFIFQQCVITCTRSVLTFIIHRYIISLSSSRSILHHVSAASLFQSPLQVPVGFHAYARCPDVWYYC